MSLSPCGIEGDDETSTGDWFMEGRGLDMEEASHKTACIANRVGTKTCKVLVA